MDIKYTEGGRAVSVIGKIARGYVVEDVYEDGEDWTGEDISIVKEVFDSAPTVRHDSSITKLKQEISGLIDQKRNLMSQMGEMEESGKSRIKKYKQYKQLGFLDDYLDGKITHFVYLVSCRLEIVGIEDDGAKCFYDKQDIKLLTLLGDSKGNLHWKLSQYSDGSGGGYKVAPCTSLEQAKSVMQEYIDERVAMEKHTAESSIIKVAEKYGLVLPGGYREEWEAKFKKVKEKEINGLKDKIEGLKRIIKNPKLPK